jgi:hypothetical protein
MQSFEKETVINFNCVNNKAEIITNQKIIINRLDKLCKEYPNYYSLKTKPSIDNGFNEYIIDKKLINFKKPRILTTKQKTKLLENLKKK